MLGDGNVTLNVEVVPGLYYAADSAVTIDALTRPGAAVFCRPNGCWAKCLTNENPKVEL